MGHLSRLVVGPTVAFGLVAGMNMAVAPEAQAVRSLSCGQSSYVKVLYSTTKAICFADRGIMHINVPGSFQVWGGSNSGYIQGDMDTKYFRVSAWTPKWTPRTARTINIQSTNGW